MSNMPLTLFLVTAVILTYLWLRRMALSGKPLLPKVTMPTYRAPSYGQIPLPFPQGPIVRPPSDGLLTP